MIKLPNITIVAVASIRIEETIKALKYSIKDIEFFDVKLFTNEPVVDPSITVHNIKKLNYEEYNRFIVFELYKYIDTEFVLIVQDDGFVINANKWDDEFLAYDYIGAPWPLPVDNFSYRDENHNLVRVGNGGFSLRSKKILSIADQLNLEWKAYYGFYNEDGFFCCHNRQIYEKEGCTFAPLDVAKHFSHESYIPEIVGIESFGFHGKNNPHNNLIK